MPFCCRRQQTGAQLRAQELEEEFKLMEQLYGSDYASTEMPAHLSSCRTEACADYTEVVKRLQADAEDLKARHAEKQAAASEAEKQRAGSTRKGGGFVGPKP
eukprot:NODE_10467_length_591_cov_11.004274_g10192_i0.p1 GENE.NODE_10467_length_591_cov_11.004274_g10192_i0~~NODE_10467_length_591_cov_11.004274_g10192_i0.p1  ORF type:complete len:120 (+),score=36.29 NODE_10467_length_591_cov_11.004274_g10192_i0:55-360(+)